ncbi:MAG: hypothetical protein NC122_10675 [Faecalibacterium sp.]|nr:hypothetical protein [Ruminococcus sp.]MCM1393182.1 hypothetical protein [Ruminococcus sp.]MCM1486654.1 hypothetical protein [Faecalibacterium sp.]
MTDTIIVGLVGGEKFEFLADTFHSKNGYTYIYVSQEEVAKFKDEAIAFIYNGRVCVE